LAVILEKGEESGFGRWVLGRHSGLDPESSVFRAVILERSEESAFAVGSRVVIPAQAEIQCLYFSASPFFSSPF
jgi:hypothetical protein